MKNLQEIGKKHQTDKHDFNHSYLGKSYLNEYEEYFYEIKNTVRNVLELGVFQGSSLKTWEEYFSNAQIWGIDIDPSTNKFYGDRIKVITGSQIDINAINQIAPNEEIDIVIDDGSHLVDHIIESFELIFPRVKSGGYYIIEDLFCTYSDVTEHINNWPGQHFNPPNTNYKNDRNKMNNFFLNIIHDIDAQRKQARFIKFTYGQCFIQKI